MAVDHIRYDVLTQKALRGVVRTGLLTEAAKNGLPGEHHFYIAFNTQASGVRISARVRAQYPQEMTVVLQHQFWDLTVNNDGFEVGVSFGGIPERLGIPFEAIKGFFDPSVQFGLQFEADAENAANPAATALDAPGRGASKPDKPVAVAPAPAPAAAEPEEAARPANGGEVVRLDRFRKK